ncbi:MAG: FAD:protein transferase [Bacteroidetes bacterium]|nr:FAD:protein transferase [Bacteroidota bacterium]
MGSAFELIVGADSREQADFFLQKGIEEIQRIEQLLTEFNEESITSLINRQAGHDPVRVEPEVYDLLTRSIRISDMTQGAFDITVGPLKQLYKFRKGANTFPDKKVLREALNKVGYRHIAMLPDSKVVLKKEGMRISFAAIGKGYAADKVKQLWTKLGVTCGVVNASGDLTVIGKKADGSNWRAGIADPDHPESILLYTPLVNASIATSGDYEQYFIKNGIRYSHTINPLTGYPLTGVKSVTIVSPSAELSDALATAVYVMGPEVGMHLIDQVAAAQCIMIDSGNRLLFSKNISFENAQV